MAETKSPADQKWDITWKDRDGLQQTTRVRARSADGSRAVIARCGGEVLKVEKVD